MLCLCDKLCDSLCSVPFSTTISKELNLLAIVFIVLTIRAKVYLDIFFFALELLILTSVLNASQSLFLLLEPHFIDFSSFDTSFLMLM